MFLVLNFMLSFSSKSSQSDASSGPELWSESEDETVDNELHQEQPTELQTVQVFTFFILLWQATFRVANIAVTVLLRFFSHFIFHLSNITKLESMKHMSQLLPDTLAKAHNITRLNRDDFCQYACCPKCFTVYETVDCFEVIGTQMSPKVCSAAKFPRHPRPSMRGVCGANLLKSIQIGQKQMYKPIKVYCYKSIASSISAILSRPGMLQACESWRNRDIFPGLYADIYDGRVWQQFHSTGFFSQPYSYGLLLNIDWFEPFEHSVYAVGVVFMSLLNLPRHIRYNQENVILCGLIPGPKEPSLTVNSFLEPLIEDLLLLWRGKEVDLPSGTICIRAALICISCDSPAMRKVGGFVSHNARKGCYKCTKLFPTASFGEKPDYSGFDRNNWISRNHSDFVEVAMKHKHAKTAKERQDIERSHGVRYTVLLTLPYYNAITFCMIDPMHNLLLGSAKTFVKLWIERSSPSRDFSCIQKEVDAFITPAGFGRLPRKVENGFANFKAQQWKNWILIYSIVCFKPVLSATEYSMWVVFVQACSLLCSRVITHNAIVLADQLIHKYCCLFEREFGKHKCYPNLHLHCHMKECLLDFGPATAFWLFAFERMNGILGSFHTSNKAVEVQLFRKFITAQQVCATPWPNVELTHVLKHLIDDLQFNKDVTSVGGMYLHIISPFERKSLFDTNQNCKLMPPIKEKGFVSGDIQLIDTCFSTYFGEEYHRTLILHKESKSVLFNGDLHGTYFSRQKSSSLVMANYKIANGESRRNPCFILNFVMCAVLFNSESEVTKDIVLLKVLPLREHPQRNHYPKPVEVWEMPNTIHVHGYFYIPLSCLICRCAYTVFIDDNSCITVVPCNNYAGVL